ncbi:ALK and LTK ligand 1 [Entelurus aequoreus]|uniref:ALK and LTK ligand 1 n=1 Tax=Entelurus aequoreus TaxID=161455 RepID=UPI002B1E9002|nr:ALK and LTK ligand 1 [Entelurus aequoreus]
MGKHFRQKQLFPPSPSSGSRRSPTTKSCELLLGLGVMRAKEKYKYRRFCTGPAGPEPNPVQEVYRPSIVMQVERKCHVLLAVLLLLLASADLCPDGQEVRRRERRTLLLDILLQVTPGGLLGPPRDLRWSPRGKPLYVPGLDGAQLVEVVPRDANKKSKFIQHFTVYGENDGLPLIQRYGPVKFSSECRTGFDRLYHNTRDCSRPAYYKRCARLLTRLAMSPLCTPSYT